MQNQANCPTCGRIGSVKVKLVKTGDLFEGVPDDLSFSVDCTYCKLPNKDAKKLFEDIEWMERQVATGDITYLHLLEEKRYQMKRRYKK